MKTKDSPRFPFLFGAQYYRAPTPEPACWEQDLRKIRDMGFNSVKYWVQWRWTHRQPDSFYFEDLDQLMELASKNNLQVTLNVIFDVAPTWLYTKYPDAKQMTIKGQQVPPYTVGHRQIGGHPGPCFSHPGAKLERKKFFKETLLHFRSAPAMKLWDVWNEPELCFPSRQPSLESLVCYCPHCKDGFLEWLTEKYHTIDRINQVWGRCYSTWDEIELPRNPGTIKDFIDWREYHLDIMATEAKWRFDLAKKLDPSHGNYLHIVPNTWFSPVSAADDFSLAKEGEAFGGTMIGQKPSTSIHVTSAGQGKICYNAESHINFGSMNLHQREINLKQLCKEFLPQIGLGVKGFLFWQYRPEVLGVESPAWGLVNLDGTDRSVTKASRSFWQKLAPYSNELLQANPEKPEIAIWRSRTNEIFHFCIRGEVNTFNQGIEGWIDELYRQNLPAKLINSQILSNNSLDDIKLLIMPMPYYLSQDEINGVISWVKKGGCLVSEAHLAAYNATTGRHDRVIPGGGLSQEFNFHESFSSAPIHFSQQTNDSTNKETLPPDVQKALREQGISGSDLFGITMQDGSKITGGYRYAELSGESFHVFGKHADREPCIIEQSVGKGKVLYIGTHLGEVASIDKTGIRTIVNRALEISQLKSKIEQSGSANLHLDILFNNNQAKYLVINNNNDETVAAKIHLSGTWKGIFSELQFESNTDEVRIPAQLCDIFTRIN